MAVLLRSLGIPARVAVGYTNGVPDKDVPGMWRVTTDNAHAWVEVLFPGYGWLPFEPTPGRTNPVAAAYTNPNACLNPQGVCAPSRGGAGGGGETQEQPRTGKNPDLLDPLPLWESPLTALDVTPVADTRRFGARAALALALIVVLVGFLLLPPARALRRRLRLRRATASPRELILATYEVFVERAGELGYRRSPGETLEEYRQRLTASGLLRDGHLDRLTRITAAAAYAPQVPDGNDSRAATAAAATTLRDIRRGTPLAMRMRGRYLREP